MNIDDLKDAWKEDCPGKINSLQSAMSGKTSSAIQRVRRNMRNELIGTIISYAIIAGFLFRHQEAPLFFNIACIVLFALTVLICYYFIRFYMFYKAISRYDTNLKESVNKAAYELELNMELYKSFNLCTTPLAILISFGVVWGKGASDFIIWVLSNGFTVKSAIWIFGSILVTFFIAYYFIDLHVRLNYGKPLKELKAIMADLQAE